MPALMMGLLLALAACLGLGSFSPALAQGKAALPAKPLEAVQRFVTAVQAGDLETLFALSASGAIKVEGRAAFDVKRVRESFQLALGGDPSLCPPDSKIGLSCRDRDFRGDRVVTDVRLFIPKGCQWEAQEPGGRPPMAMAAAQVAVKVTYTPQAGLVRVRDLKGLPVATAGVRQPIPPLFGDGWVTPDNPLLKDIQTKSPDHKFFIQYQRREAMSGEVVFQLFKDAGGWLVDGVELVEAKAVLGPAVLVDTSKK